jgi:hypothetical protein
VESRWDLADQFETQEDCQDEYSDASDQCG